MRDPIPLSPTRKPRARRPTTPSSFACPFITLKRTSVHTHRGDSSEIATVDRRDGSLPVGRSPRALLATVEPPSQTVIQSTRRRPGPGFLELLGPDQAPAANHSAPNSPGVPLKASHRQNDYLQEKSASLLNLRSELLRGFWTCWLNSLSYSPN